MKYNHYHDYYVTNKQMYLKLKKYNNVIVGGSRNTIDPNEFINRSIGTVLEGRYEILFNLLLVLNNVRLSYLLEVSNHSDIDPNILFNTITDVYDEFRYTYEFKIDDTVHRVFFHINDLVDINGFNTKDEWIARNLEFNCIGIPDESHDRVAIEYFLIDDNKKYGIYAEICKVESFDEEHFENKKDKFNRIAESIGMKVEMVVTDLMSDPYVSYMNLLLNDEFDDNTIESLIEYLDGSGLSYVNNFTKEELLENKELLLFSIIRIKYDPLIIFYPLDGQTTMKLEKAEMESFNEIRNPLELYDIFESKLEDIIPGFKVKARRENYDIIKNELFEEYENKKENLN